MLKRYYQVFGSLLLISDIVGLSGSWLLAYYLRFYTQIIPVTKGIPPFSHYAAMLLPVVFVWVTTLAYSELYSSSRIMRRTTELGYALRAHIFALGIFLALTYIVSEYRFSRGVIGIFGILAGFYVLSTRLALRNFLRAKMKQSPKSKVVLVGHGPTAKELLFRLKRMPEMGLQFVGYFGDAEAADALPCLGSIQDSVAYCEREKIAEVFIVLPRAEAGHEESLVAGLSRLPVHIHVVPDVHDYIVVGCQVESFDQLPMISLNESPIQGWQSVVKRAFDLCLSVLALLVLAPLFLLIALAVKLTSRGPTFYGQERMSLDGHTFMMWKFRSMRTDAEKESGAVWAKKDDDRRTPIGAFLRATSLDELPQFWNVLIGDMSLVGPRPERPLFVSQFKHKIPAYMIRHRVKAGVTGWAQVNGWRGDTSLERRIECDLYYIQNWSVGFDLKILFLTLWKGFVNKNAY